MVDTPTADTPREPDISHVNPAAEATWFGHPRQLARLFTTEMWERFGYYGMRALLTLYLTKHFIFGDRQATGLYGGFTALVYLTPLIGGYLADQHLGSKRAVKFGAILMSLGYFTLCFGGQTAQPFALVDGQRYSVQVVEQGGSETRYVIDGAQRLKIKGNDDKSVDLLAADGSVARHVSPDGFVSDAERSPLFVTIMLLALCMVSVGNGFFKPNISTMVGELYATGDRRRDTGFTIFYMGINLGSLGSQILCPFLATAVGWWAGFGLAAVGMLLSWFLIQFDGGKLNGYGEPPADVPAGRALGIFALALLGVPIFYFLFTNLMNAEPPAPGSGIVGYILSLSLMGKLLFGTFLIGVPAILVWSFLKGSRQEFQMMLAAMVLIVFNVVFWTLFEQAGSSLTLFADRNTDLTLGFTKDLWQRYREDAFLYYLSVVILISSIVLPIWYFAIRRMTATSRQNSLLVTTALSFVVIFVFAYFRRDILDRNGITISAGQTQFFNAAFIVILAPIMATMWTRLATAGREPSIPVKFGLALIGVGAGFLFLVWGGTFAGADFKVAIWWLAGLYLIHSVAELCISPVGLSMITKLSIARIVGLMMGVWFLSISMAQFVGGIIAQGASVETVGGQVTNLKVSLDTYNATFWTIGLAAVVIGAVLLALSPLLRKWMHGVQ